MTMMMCGCVSTGKRSNTGEPVCIAHLGIVAGADVPADSAPDLAGRTAECTYRCGVTRPSSLGLAFFRYRSIEATDEFYCGCYGWD